MQRGEPGWRVDKDRENKRERERERERGVRARQTGGKQLGSYYDKIFTDRNRRGKEFSGCTGVVVVVVVLAAVSQNVI